MSSAEVELGSGEAPKKSKKGLLIGGIMALMLGGGGFYAVQSGLILGDDGESSGGEHAGDDADHAAPELEPIADIAFVPLDPIIVSLGPNSRAGHLRFRGELEVPAQHAIDVERLIPRVIDVLNSYLRAVEPASLDEPGALTRLRAQMLRRVRLVLGEDRVDDLLVMEFVLN